MNAGQTKNLLIDAEFEITDLVEFELKHDLISISDYKLNQSTEKELVVDALVTAKDVTGAKINYVCHVPFTKAENNLWVSNPASCTIDSTKTF